MEKKLIFAVLLAAVGAPALLCAENTPEDIAKSTGALRSPKNGVIVSTFAVMGVSTTTIAPTGAELLRSFVKVPRKPIHDLISTMETAEDAKRTKTTLKLLNGTANAKTTYKISIPKDGHWRLLWEFAATDPKEQGKLVIHVDSPSDKEFVQELTKSVKTDEDPYGSMNICLTTGGEFNLNVEAYKVKWHIEVQLLK